MLLGSPDETAYDLKFSLLRIPVRVHPLFWLIMVMISGNLEDLRGDRKSTRLNSSHSS